MIVGIDVDGVCDYVPAIIRSICDDRTHTIHIITYRDECDREETEKMLYNLKIDFDHLHMPEDGVMMEDWKREVVINNNVELMIEDTPEILAALPSNVARIWVTDPEVYDLDKAIDGMKS